MQRNILSVFNKNHVEHSLFKNCFWKQQQCCNSQEEVLTHLYFHQGMNSECRRGFWPGKRRKQLAKERSLPQGAPCKFLVCETQSRERLSRRENYPHRERSKCVFSYMSPQRKDSVAVLNWRDCQTRKLFTWSLVRCFRCILSAQFHS